MNRVWHVLAGRLARRREAHAVARRLRVYVANPPG